MGKPYSYLSQKVHILNARKLDIKSNLSDREILLEHNYYNLVNAYKEPFLKIRTRTGDEEYKEHVNLKDLDSLLVFDGKMRSLFLSHILKIEEDIKHKLVDSFYLIHNKNSSNLEKQSEYLNEKYYDLSDIYSQNKFNHKNYKFHCKYSLTPINSKRDYIIDRKEAYEKFVSISNKEISDQKNNRIKNKNNSIKSYIDNHGFVPLWVLMNDLTLGNISFYYIIQKTEVQKLFLKRMGLYNSKNINELDLIFNFSNLLKILTLCRNLSAHNERFYNYEINIPLSDNFLNFSHVLPYYTDIKNMNMTRTKSDKRKNTRSGIYIFIFSIYVFLNKKEQNNFITEIKKYILHLKKDLNENDFKIVLSIMGLNFDWYNQLKNS